MASVESTAAAETPTPDQVSASNADIPPAPSVPEAAPEAESSKTSASAESSSTPATTETSQEMPAPASAEDAEPVKLEGEALKEAVLKQVEYYFSRQNLSTDAYLVSQMNAEMYVPIATIASFKMMKALTDDAELIASVMKSSKNVTVDPSGQSVRPNFQNQRNTLILRDIPSSTDPEEVKAIFGEEFGAKLSNIRSDIGDTWFISFQDESTALDVLEYVRSRTFRDKPVKARIKSENLLRNFYYAGQSAEAPPVGAPPVPGPPKYFPHGGIPGPYPPQRWGHPANVAPGPLVYPILDYEGPDYGRGDHKGAPIVGGYPPYYVGHPHANQYIPGPNNKKMQKKTKRKPQPEQQLAEGVGGEKPKDEGNVAVSAAQSVQLGMMNFPPLPSRSKTKNGKVAQISREIMIKCFQDMTDLSKPESLLKMESPVIVECPDVELESLKPWPTRSEDYDESLDDFGDGEGKEYERPRRISRGRSASTSGGTPQAHHPYEQKRRVSQNGPHPSVPAHAPEAPSPRVPDDKTGAPPPAAPPVKDGPVPGAPAAAPIPPDGPKWNHNRKPIRHNGDGASAAAGSSKEAARSAPPAPTPAGPSPVTPPQPASANGSKVKSYADTLKTPTAPPPPAAPVAPPPAKKGEEEHKEQQRGSGGGGHRDKERKHKQSRGGRGGGGGGHHHGHSHGHGHAQQHGGEHAPAPNPVPAAAAAQASA